MRVKRFLSGLLAAATLAGLLVMAPASAAGSTAFTDITDPATANAAETLRVLGVVDGTGGSVFDPGGTLTRAEFCKMAVEILGRGDEEPAQRSRTIFSDVGPAHWARGYVNLAASITVGGSGEEGGARLIMGVGDGTFRPDRAITYGEAVTMLGRVLGYGDDNVASGANWYDGYVGLAQSSGLADGLSLSGGSTLTRGQAAVLFYNLLFTSPRGSDGVYLTSLGGSLEDNVIVLSTDATAEDGTSGSVLTTSGTYKTDRAAFGAELRGVRGQIVLDKDKKLLAILPEESSTFRSVTVMGSPEANAIPVVGGEELKVTLTTPVYKSDTKTPSTYEKEWSTLRTGTALVMCYNGSGKLDYIYMRSASDQAGDDNVMVLKNKFTGSGNPFTILTGSRNTVMYKNGVPAQVGDLRQYDVGTYDKASDTLFVSDLKLCGLYEDAYPNPAAPSKVTVMGLELDVLPGAQDDLAAFEVGEKVTFLLTTGGQVAGAVSPSAASSNAVGVAEISGDKATVELLDGGLTLSGTITNSASSAEQLNGRLVTVSSYKRGQLTLSRVTGAGASAALDLDSGRLGTKQLSPGVHFFEQVDNGPLTTIERSDILIDRIPAARITYVGYDWAGRVDKVVLNDVTGDLYEYGMVYYQPGRYVETSDGEGGTTQKYEAGELSITNGSGTHTYQVNYVDGARSRQMGGAAPAGGKEAKLTGFMTLKTVKGVLRSQIDADTMTLTTPEMVLPVSDQVQCYNKATGTWYTVGKDDESHREALRLTLAFSNNLTVYYDRSPEEGGKVRIVVAE